jgi:uncharacterized MAPEG superfamily protein
MNITNWCLLFACLLPIFTVGLAKGSSGKYSVKQGGYDNRQPRVWAQQLSGWQQRAHAAHLNGFEILPLFISAIFVARHAQVASSLIDQLALAFIALRVIYVAMYILNAHLFRSLVWTAGVGVCVSLFVLSA